MERGVTSSGNTLGWMIEEDVTLSTKARGRCVKDEEVVTSSQPVASARISSPGRYELTTLVFSSTETRFLLRYQIFDR